MRETKGTLIRINPEDPEGPEGTIPLKLNAKEAMEMILEAMTE